MATTSMYGVVLWSDEADSKAVIWCEDHGKLAFYSAGDQSVLDGVSLDAGDLIHFDLGEEAHLRVVRNPQLVVEDQYPSIAARLGTARLPVPRRDEVANVVPLDRHRHAQPRYAMG